VHVIEEHPVEPRGCGDPSCLVGLGHVVLVGPTASGKTEAASAVAKRRGDVALLSADSMAVYRGMDVGTDKPPAQDRHRWRIIDLVDPSECFSVAAFRSAALCELAAAEARGEQALVVGGSALYVRALVDGLSIPPRFPALARRLAARADHEGVERLHRELALRDPKAASRIQPRNRRRVLRALEVVLGTGRPFSSFGPGLDVHPPTGFVLVGVRYDPAIHAARARARLDAMFEAGFVEEVRQLLGRPGGLSATARQAVGYRELIAWLEGELDEAEARQLALRRTLAQARRQWAWFRRDPRIRWVDPSGGVPAIARALEEALDEARALRARVNGAEPHVLSVGA
jgi:tRNA dimethylallyltransferase